jgi:hypothetical protein
MSGLRNTSRSKVRNALRSAEDRQRAKLQHRHRIEVPPAVEDNSPPVQVSDLDDLLRSKLVQLHHSLMGRPTIVGQTIADKELVELWEDMVFFSNFGCIHVDGISTSWDPVNPGVYLAFPSSLYLHHDGPNLLEDVLELNGRFKKRCFPEEDFGDQEEEEEDEVNGLNSVISKPEHVSPILLPLSCDSESASWYENVFTAQQSVQYRIQHHSMMDTLALAEKNELFTIPLSGGIAPPQSSARIPFESMIYAAQRANCCCMRRDAYEELQQVVRGYTESIVDKIVAGIDLSGGQDVSTCVVHSAGAQKALLEMGSYVVGFGYYG